MEYSLEQLNYFRICYVAFNLVPVGLRQIFRNEWDFLYKKTLHGEWKNTPQNGRDFYNKEPRRHRAKNARYLATIQNGDTSEWDCSCLFFAILYSDCIGSTLRPAIKASVDDIRQVRNDIAHINEAKLTDAEFQTYVGRVSGAFTALSLCVKEIEDVKTQTSVPTEEVKNLTKKVLHLKNELDKTKQNLNQTKNALDQAKTNLGLTKSALDQTKSDLNRTKSDLHLIKFDLDQAKSDLGLTKSDLNRTKSDLDQTKSDLQTTAESLQSTQTELQSSKKENKALVQEINLKVESFCLLPLKPPHKVIRRSSDIERLSNKMQELHNIANGELTTIYLSGNPGCGKSQLARQLGFELFSQWSDNDEEMTFVATLNAENTETLTDSYITLGTHLGITEYSLSKLETSKREKPEETMKHIRRLMLPQVRKYSKWLVVADNVVDLKSVRGFLPQTGSEEWGQGQVLITTQDSSTVPQNSPYTYHESFSRGMQPANAVELLEKVSQISDREQTANVARILDYQPLALAAAAYYVQTVVQNGSPDYNWTIYLQGLTESQRDATENVLANESLAYSKTTAAAVKMAMERAVEIDEVLCQAFSFFAVCAAEALPLDAVVKFVKGRVTDQPEELIKVKILKSSLILVSAEEEGEGLYLGLHNIVHAVLKQDTISKLKPWDKNHNIADAVKIFKTLLDLSTENRAQLSQLSIHCKCLLEHMTSQKSLPIKEFVKEATLFITVNQVVDWLGSFSNACASLCDFALAKSVVDLACSLIDNISDFGEGALLKGKIFSRSGEVYRCIGEYTQAKEFHEKALVIRKNIFGEAHPEVATSYNDLGFVYNDTGEYTQAQEFYEKALMILGTICGEENHEVARSYHKLGLVYYHIGKYSEAKIFNEKALTILEKIFGEEHRDVAQCYNNLGLVFEQFHEYNQAIEFYKKALMIRKKIFGEEDNHVSQSYNNLGCVFDYIEEYSQAKEFHEKALMIRKKSLGEDHPWVATCYDNLGQVYIHMGEYNQAKEFHEKALMIDRKILGDDHPHVATSYSNLGVVYSKMGKYSQAKEFHEKALTIDRKIFGEDHPSVATCYYNLGGVYERFGDYNQAKDLFEKALMIDRKIFGEDHPEVARYYN